MIVIPLAAQICNIPQDCGGYSDALQKRGCTETTPELDKALAIYKLACLTKSEFALMELFSNTSLSKDKLRTALVREVKIMRGHGHTEVSLPPLLLKKVKQIVECAV